MNNPQNTQKQLSQEQIDSLNALYAHNANPDLTLEYKFNGGVWGIVGDIPFEERVTMVMKEAYRYRIKPQPKMKTVIQVKEAQLPLPKEWRVSSIYNEVILSLPCHSSGDAETWQRFLASMMNNTIQVEDK